MEELAWQLDCHEGQGAILRTLDITHHGLYIACQRGGRPDLWRRFIGEEATWEHDS